MTSKQLAKGQKGTVQQLDSIPSGIVKLCPPAYPEGLSYCRIKFEEPLAVYLHKAVHQPG